MKKHDDFDLWLHDNDELAKIHGTNVTTREPIRGWPLSAVERIIFNDGTSRIYKAFRNLPIETKFYEKVQSPHVPKMFYSHSDGEQHWLLLEDLDGQHPENLNRDEMLNLAHKARKIIGGLVSAKPYRFDLSAKGYDGFVHSVIDLLSKLRKEDKLKVTDGEAIARIKETLARTEVTRLINGQYVLLYGDFKLDNILIRPDGSLAIIDWQSFLFGPEEIDFYNVMANQDIDPVPTAGITPEILRSVIIIKWHADCADRWLPDWAGFYDGQITNTERRIQEIMKNI